MVWEILLWPGLTNTFTQHTKTLRRNRIKSNEKTFRHLTSACNGCWKQQLVEESRSSSLPLRSNVLIYVWTFLLFLRGSFLLGRHQHLQGVDHVPQSCAGPVWLEHPESGLWVSANRASLTPREKTVRRFFHAVLIINQVGKMSVGYIVVVSLYLVEE